MEHEVSIKLKTETIRKLVSSEGISEKDIPEIVEAVKAAVSDSFLIVDDRQGEFIL